MVFHVISSIVSLYFILMMRISWLHSLRSFFITLENIFFGCWPSSDRLFQVTNVVEVLFFWLSVHGKLIIQHSVEFILGTEWSVIFNTCNFSSIREDHVDLIGFVFLFIKCVLFNFSIFKKLFAPSVAKVHVVSGSTFTCVFFFVLKDFNPFYWQNIAVVEFIIWEVDVVVLVKIHRTRVVLTIIN